MEKKEVTSLQDRDGIKYDVNSEIPYTGKYVSYYENGQKRGEKNYKNGELDGLHTKWYENGKKEFEGNWKGYKRVGLWICWNEEGNVTKTETYKNDELVK